MKPVPWAWTAGTARFFMIDAKGLFPLGLWLLHWTTETMAAAMLSLGLLFYLAKRRIPLKVLVPKIKVLIVGNQRPIVDRQRFRERCRY